MRPAVGIGLVVLLLARVGTGPFLDGLRLTSPAALAAALAITAVTTACCAWRWRVVASGLGVPLGSRAAFTAYYRSQFLNATLPGGVLGDVDRAVGQGRRAGRMGRSVGSVVGERTAGQVVQICLTVAVVALVPSPLRPAVLPVAVAGALVALVVLVLLVRGFRRTDDARRLLRDGRWLPILVASTVAAAGHVVVFLIAVETAGVHASPTRMLPVACVVLLAATVPTNIAGWGPREGAAAWAFAAVGLTASQGVTVAVVYGVMALVATLPGLVVLLGGWRTGRNGVQEEQPKEAVVV